MIKTACPHGHLYTPENIYTAPKTGFQSCLTCARRRASERRKRVDVDDLYAFSGNREKAILRDGEKCLHCGMSRNEHRKKFGRDITVDHIDGNGKGKSKKNKNNNIDNLQTLCLRCHGKKDIMRRRDLIHREVL